MRVVANKFLFAWSVTMVPVANPVKAYAADPHSRTVGTWYPGEQGPFIRLGLQSETKVHALKLLQLPSQRLSFLLASVSQSKLLYHPTGKYQKVELDEPVEALAPVPTEVTSSFFHHW